MTCIEREEFAEKLFRSGKNCAQSVFCAFAPDFGLTEEMAAKISCGLGGGVGRMREVCGAVTGGAMVIGLRFGEDKTVVYPIVQEFCRKFQSEASTIVCRELLARQGKVEIGGKPENRTEQYYKVRPCVDLVKLAVQILDKEIICE